MDEKFNQPIFGACSISGIVIPVSYIACACLLLRSTYQHSVTILGIVLLQSDTDVAVDTRYEWKVIFDNGGTGTVLPVFLRLLEKRKRQGNTFV